MCRTAQLYQTVPVMLKARLQNLQDRTRLSELNWQLAVLNMFRTIPYFKK